MMKLDRIVELANVLGLEDEIESVNAISENEVEINNECYLVLQEDEREEIFKEYQENLIDEMGIECFSDFARDYIINNCLNTDFFDSMKNESNEFYVNDLEEEELKELYEIYDVEDNDDLVDALNENEKDSVQWYIDNFGIEGITRLIKENNILDIDAIIDYIIEVDGYAPSLASYDGQELETDNYYIYRTN